MQADSLYLLVLGWIVTHLQPSNHQSAHYHKSALVVVHRESSQPYETLRSRVGAIL